MCILAGSFMLAYLRARGALRWRTAGAAIAVLICLVALAVSAAPAEQPAVPMLRPSLVFAWQTASAPSGPIAVEPVTIAPSTHPLDGLSVLELQRLFRQEPQLLGPTSIGRSNRGTLLNPVRLEPGPGIEVMNDERNYALPVTVSSIRTAVAEVERSFPGSLLRVGDISAARGGYIRPHRSHQTGLDADIGFYYRVPAKWYTKANAENLDRARTWTFLKALIAQGTVEYVFVDRSIQALLREHALAAGESPEFVESLFASSHRKGNLVRHTWGHLTHFHVRFIGPQAEETGRRLKIPVMKARKR